MFFSPQLLIHRDLISVNYQFTQSTNRIFPRKIQVFKNHHVEYPLLCGEFVSLYYVQNDQFFTSVSSAFAAFAAFHNICLALSCNVSRKSFSFMTASDLKRQFSYSKRYWVGTIVDQVMTFLKNKCQLIHFLLQFFS